MKLANEKVPGNSQKEKFDFLIGDWNIHNKRKNTVGSWEEFEGINKGERYIDGYSIIDKYEATFPSGFILKGLTIRAFDSVQNNWKLVWLDNYNPPDFQPLIGHFNGSIGIFDKIKKTEDNKLIKIRFTWEIKETNSVLWKQEISYNDGKDWELQWIMEFYKIN